MATARTAAEVLKKARRIARDHNLRIAECREGDHPVYVVYRVCPHGTERIGKRSAPDDLCNFVRQCATVK